MGFVDVSGTFEGHTDACGYEKYLLNTCRIRVGYMDTREIQRYMGNTRARGSTCGYMKYVRYI